MHNLGYIFIMALAVFLFGTSAFSDSEVSNFTHVVTGNYGRCYAKSVPKHVSDPHGKPRQQGHTEIYRVEKKKDVLLHRFDWFSHKLFIRCFHKVEAFTVRVGPWHRGHNPRADHLAIAFYKGKQLLKRYSTLDIAGGQKAKNGGLSEYKNVVASVSHYAVFVSGPEMLNQSEAIKKFKKNWVIKAKTVDGRLLIFDVMTGELIER